MVVMDSLTKYVHFIGLSHPYSIVKVVALFAHNALKLHGMPASIVSDKIQCSLPSFGQSYSNYNGFS